MEETKELRGTLKYERDLKRYKRFRIESDSGVVGTIYIPKDMQEQTERIVLDWTVDRGKGVLNGS